MRAIKKFYVCLALLAIAVSCHMEMPPMPVADFSPSESSCTAPCTIDFTSTSQNAESLEWEFDDDMAKATGEKVSHRFATGRRYYVKLLVKNSTGASHGVTKIMDVLPEPEAKPVAKFVWEPQGEIYVGDKVTFINQSDNSARQEWNFDDENATQSNPNTSAEDRPVHTFLKARTYNVTLTAFNSKGEANVFPGAVKVLNRNVEVFFEAQVPVNCTAPCQVSFVNKSKYTTIYEWDFGNGKKSTEANPGPVTFSEGGPFTITLTAAGPGGTGSFSVSINVKVPEVNAVAITGPGIFWGNDIVADAEGNVYVCGLVRGPADFGNGITLSGGGRESEDIFVAKYNKNLQCVWAKVLGGPGWDEAHKIVLDNAGNVYIGGRTAGNLYASFTSAPFGARDGFVARLNGDTGNFDWFKMIGGPADDSVYGIAYSPFNDRIYITGKVTGNGLNFDGSIHNAEEADVFFVFVVPSTGEVRQPTIVGGPGDQEAFAVAADNEGNAYFTGYFQKGLKFPANHNVPALINENNSKDAFVAKWVYNPGQWKWAGQAASSADDTGDDLVVDNDKNVYFTGTHNGYMPVMGIGSKGDANIFLIKWYANGAKAWWARNGVSDGQIDHPGSLAFTSTGTLLVHGSFLGSGQFPFNEGTMLNSAGDFDMFISEIDPGTNGANTGFSSKSGGGNGGDRGTGVCTTRDGHVYSIGSFANKATFNGTELTSKASVAGGLNVCIVRWK